MAPLSMAGMCFKMYGNCVIPHFMGLFEAARGGGGGGGALVGRGGCLFACFILFFSNCPRKTN